MDSPKPQKLVTVVSACIRRRGGKEVLLGLRRAPGVVGLDGKWELPGGKVEFGETPAEAIVREIREELGIEIAPIRLLPYLHTNRWEYAHVNVQIILTCFDCEVRSGLVDRAGDDARWFSVDSINFDATLPGTREFVSLATSNELLDRLYMRFESTDSVTGMVRQFSVATQATLFSNYGLALYWGRIGKFSRLRIEEFESLRELDSRLVAISRRRFAKGYRLVETRGVTESYAALEGVIKRATARNGRLNQG